MKQWIILLGLLLAGCTAATITSVENSGTASVNNVVGTGAVIDVQFEAWQWDFSPKEIRVKEGDTVRITATSRDVTHGLGIPEFGFNMQIVPGKVNTGEFVAAKKGTFPFACSVFCGEGHGTHNGVLIVE